MKIPSFFTRGSYRKYLKQGDTVLIFPFGLDSYEMLWQAMSNMYFRIAGGHLTAMPLEYQQWPILASFSSGDLPIDAKAQLLSFLAAHHASTVLVDSGNSSIGRAVMSSLGLQPLEDGGMLIYEIPPDLLDRYRGLSSHQVAERLALISFSRYVEGAHRYWNSGKPIAELTPWGAAKLGFLKLPSTKTSPANDSRWWREYAWLGPWSDCDCVGIGLLGSYRELRSVIEIYQPDSTEAFFPYPKKLGEPSDETSGQLLLTFTRDGLSRAVEKSSAVETRLSKLRSNPGAALR